MIETLIGQLIAPPLQGSPVRLPGPSAIEKPSEPQPQPQIDINNGEQPPESTSPKSQAVPASPPAIIYKPPAIQGLTVYGPEQTVKIFQACLGIASPQERLSQCAADLTARMVADGYINSRVYTRNTPPDGELEVVEGVLADLRVISSNSSLERRVKRLLLPLQGKVLNINNVRRQLELLRRLPNVSDVRGNLSRLGSDASQAIFTVNVESRRLKWQGEFSLRNDGSPGTGEYRGSGTLLKGDVGVPGDILLIYGEMNWTSNPTLGSLISSASYTYPINPALSLTGSVGYTRNDSPELDTSTANVYSDQVQGLAQLEYVFRDTLDQRWSLFAGFSANQNTVSLAIDDAEDLAATQDSSYLRFGLSGSGASGSAAWNGSAYFLQGISGTFIDASDAHAIGGLLSAGVSLSPSFQINGRLGGQIALGTLPTSMYFSVGSDIGIRGLPGQLISGEDGWMATAELAWTFWRSQANALQLVPFIGAGGVHTDTRAGSFDDTVGAGGLLARWLGSENWLVELGWVQQFQTNDNLGIWNDWLLDSGLYAQVKYRF